MAYLEATSGANLSTAQAITATAASTNVFDVTGAGAGNSPAMIGSGGVNTALGYDIGAGEGVATPQVMLTLGTVTTATGTLTVALQVAADNGSYSPGTYFTIYQTPALTGTTQLAAGEQIIIPVPPVPPGILNAMGAAPRFYRLNYTVTATISLIASASILLNAPTIRDATLYGNNFPSGL